MNTISIIGNLVDSPELRYTQTGKAVCNMRIAVNNPYNKDETYFFTVIMWNKLAETVANSLTKGQKVGVTGRLTSRSYKSKDDGKATAVEIVADSVDFLTPKKQNQPADSQAEWDALGTASDDETPF